MVAFSISSDDTQHKLDGANGNIMSVFSFIPDSSPITDHKFIDRDIKGEGDSSFVHETVFRVDSLCTPQE